MSYVPLTALLVEAVKEQQQQIKEIEKRNREIEDLKTQITLLQQMVMEMAAREE